MFFRKKHFILEFCEPNVRRKENQRRSFNYVGRSPPARARTSAHASPRVGTATATELYVAGRLYLMKNLIQSGA